MWSRVALCFLVATAYASTGPAWKDNTEYVYTVRGRSLSSLENVADQYSGIQIKSKLIITPKSSGMLQGRILEPQYAQIHTSMPHGINQYIPDSELNYKQLPWSNKPFEMEMKDGYIRSLFVEKELKNWEINMIKSIVSQFQLDVQGKKGISSPMNIRGQHNDAVFKTMEETVTGETETLYEIHELPEYMIQAQPELVPVHHLKNEGEVIEVIKTQNYTNSYNRPVFHSGLKQISEAEPTANIVENFFSRISTTRAVLTGKLSRFTVQSVSSLEKILVATSDNQREFGSVETVLNVTLAQVQTRGSQIQELSNPINAGHLVYRFLKSNNFENEENQNNSEESSHEESSEENQLTSDEHKRLPRSLRQQIRASRLEESAEFLLAQESFGNLSQDIVGQKIRELTQQITEELKNSDKVLEKSTLSKYSFLTYWVAKMNEQELKSLAEEIYSESQEQGKKDTWFVFRDAVAEAGSGPVLPTVQHWIETKKIQHYEAGMILSTVAASAHTPTVEYMRKFFQIVRSDYVASQSGVNETALLSYANLVNQVYVNRNVSHNQYAVHGFGKFRTQEGKKLMKETIIPYLSQQLDKAVHEADTRKIHVFIRALGNIGHKQILSAFEKYLEGDKQCSQFQRLMMVVSLDKLATSYPEIARAVLYRVYQNAGELQQIRVAAVYQIVRTNPPRELLQRMAIGTNFDKDQQVNAAVKSVIENLSQLRNPSNENMRQAGEAAKHLLTRTTYGIQNYMLLKDYVVGQMQQETMSTVQSMAQPESFLPNVLKYNVGKSVTHMNQQYFSAEYMVSSIKELLNVLQEQTQEYYQQRSQRSQQGEQQPWSSAKVADLLNMQLFQKEQLEGFIYTEMGVLSQVLSFDNRSIEQLPELIREKLETLENGKHFSTTKMGHAKQISIVFPTIMGLQFYYKYDAPLLMKAEGQIKFAISPRSSHNKVHCPEEITGHLESDITLSGKLEGQVGFATLFDHRRYMAGFTKNLQISVPVKATYKFDLKNQQGQIEFDKSVADNRRAVHYSSWPFTTSWSLNEHSSEPIAERHVIRRDNQRNFETVFGQKSTGLAFKVWGNHPEEALNMGYLVQVFRSEGPMAAWEQLIKGTQMEQSEFNIGLLPQQSETQKITLHFGHKSQYFTSEGKQSQHLSQWLNEDQSESSDRLQKMMHLASSEIQNERVHAVDAFITFQGQQNKQYSITVGLGINNANLRSNILAFFRKSQGEKWSQAGFEVRKEFKNIQGFNLVFSMLNEPEGKFDYELFYKTNQEQKPTEIKGTVQLKRTEERKNYLVEQPEYEQCKNEMKHGNHQTEACARMIIQASFFNKIEMELQHQNLNKEVLRATREIYQAAQWYYLPSISVQKQRNQEDMIRMEVKFQPNFYAYNISLQTHEEKLKIQDLFFNSGILRNVVNFYLGSSIVSRRLTSSMCVLDKTATRTFDGLSYPSQWENEWIVMMHYAPQQASYQQQAISQQLQNQIENYVVLAREQPQQKQVRIIFNSPLTQGQEVEIDLTYNNGKVSVVKDGKEIDLTEHQNTEIVREYVQGYKLPNQEVKIEFRNGFYVIYDGQRVKLTPTSDKLRHSVLGLCGNYDGNHLNEMQTPENCLVNNPKQLIESYKVSQNRRTYEDSQCIPMERPRYVNVIRGEDTQQRYQEQNSYQDQQEQQEGETQLRQRFVEEKGQICFTIRPVPSCKNDATETYSKDVPVHCVANPKQANYFKNQIQRGGNPDFSHKHVTKTVTMQVDRQCA